MVGSINLSNSFINKRNNMLRVESFQEYTGKKVQLIEVIKDKFDGTNLLITFTDNTQFFIGVDNSYDLAFLTETLDIQKEMKSLE
jgi:hypothetical protein